jgi:hypothetical protein
VESTLVLALGGRLVQELLVLVWVCVSGHVLGEELVILLGVVREGGLVAVTEQELVVALAMEWVRVWALETVKALVRVLVQGLGLGLELRKVLGWSGQVLVVLWAMGLVGRLAEVLELVLEHTLAVG